MVKNKNIKAPLDGNLAQLLRGRFRPLLTTAALYISIACILRIVLFVAFGRHFDIGLLTLPLLLLLGLLNDLFVLPPLLLPLTLALLFFPNVHKESRVRRMLAHTISAVVLFGLLYLAVTQYFFFDEFNSRFNLVAVDYLIYPYEVFINIWQTYHVLWFLIGTASITAILQVRLAPLLVRRRLPPARFSSRLKFSTLHLLLAITTLTLFSADSLALFSNRVANEIAANGISSFFRALHTNELDYNQYYRTLSQTTAFSTIRKELGLKSNLPVQPVTELNRRFPGYPDGLGKLNIVIIVEESFGAQFVGSYGDSRGLTPYFDQLSRQGLLFANAYASGTRTVRGLAAIVTSMPPIPSEGIIKRPGSGQMANWGSVMRQYGYQTSFLYGGHGIFDNMNHFFSSNGFATSDIAAIKNISHKNIWGACDEDLFQHAIEYYAEETGQTRPFFSVIMTTSNHQPYTFPDTVPSIPTSGGGRMAGIMYADYALGTFIAQAKKTSWGKNTLFVIVADHDARVYGSERIPMRHYEIPLLLLAPGRIKPQVVQQRIGQIDIAPTVMGLLGLPFSAPFYGQDILHQSTGQGQPILVNHGRDIGLLIGNRLAVLGLHKTTAVFAYDSGSHEMSRTVDDPTLVDLATAYFQTAFDLFESRRYQLPDQTKSIE